MSGPGPFTLAPRLFSKPWGGSALEPLLGVTASGQPIGEAWLLADLEATSPSGAGGGAVESIVEAGWGAGRSLRSVMAEDGPRILGRPAQRFPLLLKLLEAQRHLSVQVHPSPAFAQRTPGAHVKTEAWYALRADPEASFMVGVRGAPDRGELERLARREEIGAAMQRHQVAPGDAVWIPSGTIHALGAGSLVFEVQSASDTTYRLYDWSRETGQAPRELHVETALEAMDAAATPQWSHAASRGDAASAVVFDTPAFALETRGGGNHALATPSPQGGAVLLLPLAEGAVLEFAAGRVPLRSWRITVVPAALVPAAHLHVPVGGTVLLVGVR